MNCQNFDCESTLVPILKIDLFKISQVIESMSELKESSEQYTGKEVNRMIGFLVIWFAMISSIVINFIDNDKGAFAFFAFLLFVSILGATVAITNTLKAIDVSKQYTRLFFQK